MATAASMEPHEFISALWHLQSRKLLRFTTNTPSICVQFKDLWTSKDSQDAFIQSLFETLNTKLEFLENARVVKLDELYDMIHTESKTIDEWNQQPIFYRPETFITKIREYFNGLEDTQPTQKWGFRDTQLVQKQKER